MQNIAAGNMDTNTVNLFQELIKQQQQSQLVMAKLLESMASLEGLSPRMNPPVNYAHKIPVSE